MKKLKMIMIGLFAAALIMGVTACSQPSNSDGGGSSEPDNPFDGTSWYGNTKDSFTGEEKTDVKLLVFDQAEYNGALIYRCENVETLYFGGSSSLQLNKGQKQPYTVEKKSDGSYVATTQIFQYSVVIPNADSTTGYIEMTFDNETLRINITKK